MLLNDDFNELILSLNFKNTYELPREFGYSRYREFVYFSDEAGGRLQPNDVPATPPLRPPGNGGLPVVVLFIV